MTGVGGGQGREADGANAMEAFLVGAEQGTSEVCPAFGAVDLPSLALSVAITLSSHTALVGLVAHASGAGGRQTNHQFRFGSISFKSNAFKQANKHIQGLLEPLPVFG